MGDISPAPPVRIEPSSSGEERNTREKLAQKLVKPGVATRKEPAPPDVELEKEEKHQLDERA